MKAAITKRNKRVLIALYALILLMVIQSMLLDALGMNANHELPQSHSHVKIEKLERQSVALPD